MADHTVRRRGTDSSGRGIFASDYMWSWWLRVCDDLGFTPTIVQGAWMTLSGGGASKSAGYHDGGGCFDLRTWNLTADQIGRLIRTLRRYGAAAWVRDARHGMDPHIHFVLGSDHDIDDGARWQWQRYLAGRDGLSGDGDDYHWRPDPIVTKPPPPEDYMSTDDAKERLKRIEANQKALDKKLDALRAFIDKRVRATAYKRDTADAERDKALAEAVDELKEG